jgi:WD40 repeat protein
MNSVESLNLITTNSDTNILLSGDWSGNLFGWNVTNLENLSNQYLNELEVEQLKKKKKRKGNDQKAIKQTSETENIINNNSIKPLFTIKAHAQSLSHISTTHTCFDNNNNNNNNNSNKKVFTSSWDHSIKEWDIELQDCITTKSSSKVITSIDYSSVNNLILSSHTDGKARLWDTRQNSESSSMQIAVFGDKSSHAVPQWVSQVFIQKVL